MKAAGDADERNVCNDKGIRTIGGIACPTQLTIIRLLQLLKLPVPLVYHHYHVHTRCIISRTVTSILIEIIS